MERTDLGAACCGPGALADADVGRHREGVGARVGGADAHFGWDVVEKVFKLLVGLKLVICCWCWCVLGSNVQKAVRLRWLGQSLPSRPARRG